VKSTEERTSEFLRTNTGLKFCDGCLALKVGVSLQPMQEAMMTLQRFPGYGVGEHRCSMCQRRKPVIRAMADSPRRR
jgi:hypothetical protein